MKKAAISLIVTLTAPTSIVSVFGPTIIALNILWLRNGLSNCDPAFGVLSNPWSLAVIEHSIQLYTLFLAGVIFQIAAVGWVFDFFRGYGPDQLLKRLSESSNQNVFWLLVLIIQFIVFVWLLMRGVLADRDVVALYVPIDALQQLKYPPLSSPITWLRGVVAVLGMIHSHLSRPVTH